ncbi:MAG: peptide chain release factor N(5)-glutamine methyltransferase [Candidatus Marinimicrobia bacterium]|nr:peptide chain release factor N(5)-glutamine methyltransferase [Candidatus Neomarinimicrobiota bacterium]
MKVSTNGIKKTWRIIEIIKWGEEYFKLKGFENPKQEIEWLLCDLLQLKRIDLYLKFEDIINKSKLKKLKNWIKRRIEREPLQYITGKVEFYGLKFISTPQALIPRPETERLVDITLNSLKKIPEPKILEIGTGSGCVSIAVSNKKPRANILSLDISKNALELAEINAKSNNCKNINFLEMDFLNEIPDGRFDILISNPPYIPQKEIENIMPEVKDYEPRIALTDFEEGLNFYYRIAKVGRTLIPNGIIILEVGLGNHPQKVFSLFKEAGFDQLELIKDYNNNERILKINI